MDRFTHRKPDSNLVFIPAYKGADCMGSFCKHAETCELIPTRECAYLKVIDKLADIEDLCEKFEIVSMNHLTDILTYCNSVGIINKILLQYAEGKQEDECQTDKKET